MIRLATSRSRLKFALIGLLAGILTHSTSYAAYSHAREASLGPIKLTQSEVSQIFLKMREVVDAFNKTKNPNDEQSLVLEDGVSTNSLSGDFDWNALKGAPEVEYSLSYEFRAYLGSKPVSWVKVDFSDFRRQIRVSGTDSVAVDNVFTQLKQDFEAHVTYFGGTIVRIALWMLVLLVGLVLATGASISEDGSAVTLSPTRYGPLRWVGYALELTFAFGLNALPTEKWFPGTAVFSGNADFLVRYSPQISFASLLISLLSLPFWVRFLPKKRANEAAESPPVAN